MKLEFNKRTIRNHALMLLAFVFLAVIDLVMKPTVPEIAIPELICSFFLAVHMTSMYRNGYVIVDDKRIRNRFLWPTEIQLTDIVEVRKRPDLQMIITSPDKEIRIRLNWLREQDREHLEEVMRGYGYRN